MPIVTIDWLNGRGVDQKKTAAREITDTIVKLAKCAPEAVTVIFNERTTTDISKAGVLYADK